MSNIDRIGSTPANALATALRSAAARHAAANASVEAPSTAPPTAPAAGPGAAPAGASPALWAVLTPDERSFFAELQSLGSVTYKPGGPPPAAPAPLGGRIDVRG